MAQSAWSARPSPRLAGAVRGVAPAVGAGAVAGVAAGIPFLMLTQWFVHSLGNPASLPLRMMSTLVLGDAAMTDGRANAALGLLVHVVLSAAFGAGFAVAARHVVGAPARVTAGLVYGGLLYLVNFHIFAETVFTTFQGANKPFELAVHLLFGAMLAALPAAAAAEGATR
jgi:hypothetical protein